MEKLSKWGTIRQGYVVGCQPRRREELELWNYRRSGHNCPAPRWPSLCPFYLTAIVASVDVNCTHNLSGMSYPGNRGFMNTSRITFPLVLVLSVAIIGGALAALIANMVDLKASAATTSAPDTNAGSLGGAIIYNPPKPEDAPKENREAVMLGYDILNRTPEIVPAHVGNKLTCTNCHFEGGRNNFALSLVGVAATYPKFRSRTKYSTHLVSRVNECFERSMNGKPLDPEGKEMQAMEAYFLWIARGLPIYGEFPWLGIKRIKSDYKGDTSHGKQLWADRCSALSRREWRGHADRASRLGGAAYNDGAGMHRVDNFAGFSLATMPKGTPDLKPDEAIDLATFVRAQPRPHFTPAKQNK